jgi:hypothetical protein
MTNCCSGVVVLGGVWALSLGYYYFPKYGGYKWFRGPVPNIEAIGMADTKEKSETASTTSDDVKKGGSEGRTQTVPVPE